MSSSPVSSSPAAQAGGTAASSRAGQAGKKGTGDDAAPGGIFASLLALVGATHDAPLDAPSTLPADVGAGEEGTDAAPQDNPFLAMLGWLPPATTPALTAADIRTGTDTGELGTVLSDSLTDATLLAEGPGADVPLPAALAADGPSMLGMKASRGETLQGLSGALPTGPDAGNSQALTPPPVQEGLASGAKALPPQLSNITVSDSGRRSSATDPAQMPVAAAGTQWRNVASPGVVMQRAAQQQSDALRIKGTTAAAQGRSTVDLNDRYGASKAVEAPVTVQTGNVSTLSALDGTAARPGSVGQLPIGADPAAAQAGGAEFQDTLQQAQAADTKPPTESATQTGMAETDADINWGMQGMRHASLRVADGAQEAIDVRLSLSGQQVHVDFRTDSSEARASLQHSANQSLGDMLQRNGIQLGGVSVGAQGQPQGQGSEQRQGHAGNAQGREQGAPAPVATAPSVPKVRADGSRPLDLFV